MFLNSISAGAGRISFPPVILLNPVTGDGRPVGEDGVCREFPGREPTGPLLTAFSIKYPPDEAVATAAVVKDSLEIMNFLSSCIMTNLNVRFLEQWWI